ncbi:MFS transporter [Cellulophaga sp. BC115SP]|uniref:MFS transporter n=1 Tax=Cellulophaga sp. BC115SP TaxID=2683263 RepID=UPI0014126794|nr:MFS transporter [Cellulophaga sp. BC115SP]NBB31130.1 MFS transporter [Cellulophaga sp. BC115SP]
MEQTQIFTPYQKFMIAVLSFIQFTVVLDFMVLSPLGAILMPELHITPQQFGLVVSAYAFSAGASGLLAAGFADKFDRKKFLLFFYVGFLIGTAFCAMAPTYELLMTARIFTGIFGGVIGSVSVAVISDIFKPEVRGRVMGFVQMSFAASQVLGLPIGLQLANMFDWHAPFWMIVMVGVLVGIIILLKMQPLTQHLAYQKDGNPFVHLFHTVSKPNYLRAFSSTVLLATGGFMLMPFGSAFSTKNLGLTLEQLPVLYAVTGVAALFFGPMIGKLSDRFGKYNMFVIGSLISSLLVGIFCNLGTTPLQIIMVINVIMFAGISSRMISASALMTSVPNLEDRGAFMSVNSSIQQISGGLASLLAGAIVVKAPDGHLERYDWLGYTVIASMIISVILMKWVDNFVKNKEAK